MFVEKKRFCCIKANTGGAAGQMIMRGTKWEEAVLLWNISVRELGCRPPPREGEPGSAHCSGKISMGTPLALHRLVDGAKLM